MAWAAWGKARPLATEVTFRGAPLGAAVAALAGLVGDRDVAPGQGGKLGVQSGLVALDDQQVVSAAPGQVGGVVTLGMQGIGGDDRAGDIHAVQQRAEQGDLVGLRAHLHLAQYHAMGVIESRQQVAAVFIAMPRAA